MSADVVAGKFLTIAPNRFLQFRSFDDSAGLPQQALHDPEFYLRQRDEILVDASGHVVRIQPQIAVIDDLRISRFFVF